MTEQPRLAVERQHTKLTGDFLAIRSPGKAKAYTQSMPECQAVPLRPDDRVADVGAFVGEYALRCARFPVAAVRAYEPTPLTFDVLRRNLDGLPNATAVHAAVVGESAQASADLFLSRGNGTRNGLRPRKRAAVVRVPAVYYGDVVQGASVVKIDVEGAEWTFPIADHLAPPLRALIVEFHPRVPSHAAKASWLIERVGAAGFRMVYPQSVEAFWARFHEHGRQWSAHMAWVRP